MKDDAINEEKENIIKLIKEMSSITEDTIDNKIEKLKLVTVILNRVIILKKSQFKIYQGIYPWETNCINSMISKQKVLLNALYDDIMN